TLAGYVVDRVGPLVSLIAAAAVLALGGGAASGGDAALLAVGMFLLGAQVGADPILAALMSRGLPPAPITLGYSTLPLVSPLGRAVAAVVAGLLYNRDPHLPLLASAALAIPVATAVVLFGSRIARSQGGNPQGGTDHRSVDVDARIPG